MHQVNKHGISRIWFKANNHKYSSAGLYLLWLFEKKILSQILFIDTEQDSNTESLIKQCKEPKV